VWKGIINEDIREIEIQTYYEGRRLTRNRERIRKIFVEDLKVRTETNHIDNS